MDQNLTIFLQIARCQHLVLVADSGEIGWIIRNNRQHKLVKATAMSAPRCVFLTRAIPVSVPASDLLDRVTHHRYTFGNQIEGLQQERCDFCMKPLRIHVFALF